MSDDRNYSASASFDVVIAGAGLAGSSLAIRLARSGVKVLILDPNVFPRDKTCGEFLSPESWEAFDDLGLSDTIEQLDYQPIHRVRLTTPRGREVVARVVGDDGRPGIGLSRFALDELLLNEARAAGASVWESVRATGPILEEGRVVGVTTRSVQGTSEVRASVTVAADGRQSALVKQTGSTRGRSWFRPRLFGLKRHLEPQNLDLGEQPGTVGLHLVRGGYGGTCRVEGNRTNLCALLPESAVRARRGDLDRVAIECLGANPALARLLGADRSPGTWKTVAGVQVQISRPLYPGILYAGDGQGTVDPLGGQGMTMALLGSAVLAPVITASLAGGRDGVDSSVQDRWHRAWRQRFDRRIHLCRAFHHFLIRPELTDLASLGGPIASRFLAACYGLTRDSKSGQTSRASRATNLSGPADQLVAIGSDSPIS